ncbi:MAG: hypothetical protein HEQ39_05420 [Rhizobacter sp.]
MNTIFSNAQQGKFYKPDVRLIPPATDEGQAVDELRALLSERQAQAQRGELMGGSNHRCGR